MTEFADLFEKVPTRRYGFHVDGKMYKVSLVDTGKTLYDLGVQVDLMADFIVRLDDMYVIKNDLSDDKIDEQLMAFSINSYGTDLGVVQRKK